MILNHPSPYYVLCLKVLGADDHDHYEYSDEDEDDDHLLL